MEKNKILIVEDEAIIALEIEDRLTAMGFLVCGTTSSGEKAILLTEQNAPDLILMDVKLRGKMNGIETANIIYDRFRIPSIFVTAFMDEREIDRVNAASRHQYLLKPIDEDELKKAIESELNNK
jgi:DNA-binding NarL/FixJ family response regulator